MIVQSVLRPLALEQIGDITVASFTVRTILDQELAGTIGRELVSLVKDQGCKKLVINFAKVERLTTFLIAKIVAIHQMIEAQDGRLAVCRIHPQVFEIFKILRLTKILDIYDNEQDALESFSSK